MSERAEMSRPGACPRCGADSVFAYVVHANGIRVRSSRSISWHDCEYREARSRSGVTEEVAALFYERDGRWTLTLMEVCGPESDAARAVADLLDLSQEDAYARLRRPPENGPAFAGVKAVIDEAGAFLAAHGILARVGPDGGPCESNHDR